jgi:acetyl esterase/lipase
MKVVIVFSCLLFLSSLPMPQVSFSEDTKIERGIVFGRGGDVDLKLDIAYPTFGDGPFPAIVYIFGGGWGYYSADRSQCLNSIRYAATKGYVAATVDYRLTSVKVDGRTKYLFPAQLYDVKAAVRWMRANAQRYKIDPDRIAAVGWSSGAHLALLLGLTDPSDDLEGDCGNAEYSSRVQAVVATAGMVEAVSFYTNTNVPARVSALLGGDPIEVPEQYEKASPLTFLSAGDPPVLFIQGDSDFSCPPSQVNLLVTKAAAVGTLVSVLIKKGVGHVSQYDGIEQWDFLSKHLSRAQ